MAVGWWFREAKHRNLEKVLEELEEVEMEVGWEEVDWKDGKVCRGGAEILVS